MTPAALKVATDILRELGMDDVARWVEHPAAVRHLLNYGAQSTDASFEEHSECFDCGCTGAHGRTVDVGDGTTLLRVWCRTAAAWRALGDPRGDEDIERARGEANQHEADRIQATLGGARHGELERIRQNIGAGLLWPR